MLIAGKYRLVRRIGEGGMGAVWQARHEITERLVAVKFLGSAHAESPALLRRFLREAKLAGRLKHPGLIEVFDAGVLDSTADGPYLVMELLDGVPLDRALHRAGKLPVGVSLEILRDVANAMVEVHDKGIIHRDLKPGNIFMHRPGTGAIVAKVLDFGISKLSVSDSGDGTQTLTRSGVVIGSPRYMSPEQAAGDSTIDVRSDVHAMGAILWECIAGEPLFTGLTPTNLAAEILAGKRRRLDRARDDVPRCVADLIELAVSIERERRQPSAAAFAEAIERAMRDTGHEPILGARDGAALFMDLLGPDVPDVSAGTSMISNGARADHSAPPLEIGVNTVDPVAPTGLAEPPHRPSLSGAATTAPTSRRAVRLTALVVGVLCVGVMAGLAVSRSFSSSSAVAPPVTHVSSITVVPQPPAETKTTPVASTSVAPPVSSGPAATSTPNTTRTAKAPAEAKPQSSKPPAASATGTRPPINHGITESGL